MRSASRFVTSAVLAVASVIILFPYVDKSATRVVLAVSGLGLILAWYSILDLREHRQERWWPHTLDRLMRASFTAISLVLVVNLAATTNPAPLHPEPAEAPADSPPATVAPALPQRFITAISVLAKEPGTWNKLEVQRVVDEHFATAKGTGAIWIALGDNKRFRLVGKEGSVTVETVQ